MQGNLARVKQTARLQRGVNLPASSSKMEASTGRIPKEGGREVQSARPTLEISSPGSVQEEGFNERTYAASPSGRDMEVDETMHIMYEWV